MKLNKGTKIRLSISCAMALFGILLFVCRHTPYTAYVMVGMILGFHGDICLAKIPMVRKIYKDPFLVGSASFLVGHLCYIVAFVVVVQNIPWSVFAIALAIYAAVTFLIWWRTVRSAPNGKSMRYVLLAYALFIGIMASFAFTVGYVHQGFGWLPAMGGLLFVISDTLIAVDDFGGVTIPNKDNWIWGTYVPAQLFIVCVGLLF